LKTIDLNSVEEKELNSFVSALLPILIGIGILISALTFEIAIIYSVYPSFLSSSSIIILIIIIILTIPPVSLTLIEIAFFAKWDEKKSRPFNYKNLIHSLSNISSVEFLMGIKRETLPGISFSGEFFVAKVSNFYIFSRFDEYTFNFIKFLNMDLIPSDKIVLPKFPKRWFDKISSRFVLYSKTYNHVSIPIDNTNYLSGDAIVTIFPTINTLTRDSDDYIYHMLNKADSPIIDKNTRQQLTDKLIDLRNSFENLKSNDLNKSRKNEEILLNELVKSYKLEKCIICLKKIISDTNEDQRNLLFCPFCGSGGHKDHLDEWFTNQKSKCPVCKRYLGINDFVNLTF
jgi:hypothetical protein